MKGEGITQNFKNILVNLIRKRSLRSFPKQGAYSLLSVKVKSKFHPRTGHEGPKGEKSIALLFLQPRR